MTTNEILATPGGLPQLVEWIRVFLTPFVLLLSVFMAWRLLRHHRRTGTLEGTKSILQFFHGENTERLRQLYELCEDNTPHSQWGDRRDLATAVMADLNIVGHLCRAGLLEERLILPEYSDLVCKCWIAIQPHRDAHPSPEEYKWPGFKWFARKAYESRGCPTKNELADWFHKQPKGYAEWDVNALFPRERLRQELARRFPKLAGWLHKPEGNTSSVEQSNVHLTVSEGAKADRPATGDGDA